MAHKKKFSYSLFLANTLAHTQLTAVNLLQFASFFFYFYNIESERVERNKKRETTMSKLINSHKIGISINFIFFHRHVCVFCTGFEQLKVEHLKKMEIKEMN